MIIRFFSVVESNVIFLLFIYNYATSTYSIAEYVSSHKVLIHCTQSIYVYGLIDVLRKNICNSRKNLHNIYFIFCLSSSDAAQYLLHALMSFSIKRLNNHNMKSSFTLENMMLSNLWESSGAWVIIAY